MADRSSWWFNRAGDAAAATSSRTSPTPDFGVAMDIGQANLTPDAYNQVINYMMTEADDQDMAALQTRAAEMMAQGDVQGALRLLQDNPELAEKDDDSLWGRIKGAGSKVVGGIGSGISKIIGGSSSGGVAGFGAPAVVQEAAQSVADTPVGEGIAAAGESIAEQQERGMEFVGDVADKAHDAYMFMDQVVATPFVAATLSDGGDWTDMFKADTWAEAWDLSGDNLSAGQAVADIWAGDAETVSGYYRAGFDETGRPRDRAYAELRENSTWYNLTSGTLDFAKAWFLDPLVIGGKVTKTTRAAWRGDLENLPRNMAARVRNIATMTDEQVDRLFVPKWDFAGQRALKLRERMLTVRDEVRKGERDVTSLIQGEAAFADSPDAAALFEQASKAKKFDPTTGTLTDEFDDDMFRDFVGASLGHGPSQRRLAQRGAEGKELQTALDHMRQTRVRELEELANASARKVDELNADESLSGFSKYWRTMNAEKDWMAKQEAADSAREVLRGYESHLDFITKARTRAVDQLRIVPGGGQSLAGKGFDVATHVYRPAGSNGVAEAYTRYPIAALRRRPGVADLHRPGQTHETLDRWFDQAVAYGSKGIDDPTEFNQIRREFTNRAARATTDAQRSQVLKEAEEYGFEIVARSHGLEPEAARAIAQAVQGRRESLFASLIEKHGPDAKELSFVEDGVKQTIELTATQLQQNYFMTDLRALDGILSQHGHAIGETLRDSIAHFGDRASERATTILEQYNHLWKPMVLFRLGYPIRTVADDWARAFAVVDNMATLIGRSSQAALIGTANIVPRTGNMFRAPWKKMVQRQWDARNADVLKGVDGSLADMEPVRLRAIEERLGDVDRYEWDSLHAQANGSKLKTRHKVIDKLDRLLRDNPEEFAIDIASGRKVKTTEGVYDFGLSRARIFDKQPTGVELARYARENADRLSHTDGVLTVQRTTDGWRVSIGRKGPNNKPLAKMQQRSMARGVTVGSMSTTPGDYAERQAAYQRELAEYRRQLADYDSQVDEINRLVEENPAAVQVPEGLTKLRRIAQQFDPQEYRPEGVHYTPADAIDETDFYGNRWEGDPHWVAGRFENTLDIDEDALSPGWGAFIELAGDKKYRRFSALDESEMRAEIQRLFPEVQLDRAVSPRDDHMYYMEIYGAQLARQQGYDSIRSGDELVDLSGGEAVSNLADVAKRDLKRPAEPKAPEAPHEGKYEFGAPAEAGVAENYIPLNSSGPAWQSLARSHESNVAQMRAEMIQQGRSTTIRDGLKHAENWARTVNRLFVKDPVVRRVLEIGPDETARWLRNTSEGRQVAQRLHVGNPVSYTDRLSNQINALLPDEALRTKVINGEELIPEELHARMQTHPNQTPAAVDGPAVELATHKGRFGDKLNGWVDKVYHVLATVPTDTLVRNPFFRSNYQARLRGMVDTLEDGAIIDDATKQLMEKSAREWALKQTRRYMFSLADETDLVHTMRFLMPFMGAWQETMTKWMTILSERPEQIYRIWGQGWQNMDELWFLDMVDEQGRSKDDPEHGDLTNIRLPVPKWMKKNVLGRLIGDDAAQYIHSVNLDKNGMNAILQGSPFWLPGGGPVMQFPAALLLDDPTLKDQGAFESFMYKYLFPTGKPSMGEIAFPASWMQQAFRFHQGMDDPQFRTLAARIHQLDVQRWEAEGRPQGMRPTESEAIHKAKSVQAMMVAGRFASPTSFQIEVGQPESEVPAQFFIDAARRIQAEEDDWNVALDRFLTEFGDDAYAWWVATSNNKTGVPATSAAHKMQKQFADVINDNPEVGLAIVGLDTQNGPFNYEVYAAQEAAGERTRLEPGEVQAKAEANMGWREWHKLQTSIDAQLAARGLNTVTQSGAEDLLQIQRYTEMQLNEAYPGWQRDREEFDKGYSYQVIRGLQSVLDSGQGPDPNFRQDWRGIAEYLQLHNSVGAELDRRFLAGGSRDITTQANADLKWIWDANVGQLVQSNLQFADLYHRMLEKHELTMGSGGL